MHAGCSPFMLNCSQPDAPSLLEALKPVFNLKSIRPVMNVSTPTTVNIFIILFGILGVDEKAQILTTFIWQQLDWRNEFILWDPEQCGSQWITIPRKLLWVPDVVINEFMEKNSAPFAPYNYVYFNGSVVDAQPVRVISSCRLDIYLFPFDVQNCSLSFNSYLYRKYELQIDLLSSAEDMFDFSKEVMATMGEWELIGITVKKFDLTGQDEETYQEIRFYISLRRRATLYVVNLLVPSCSLITVDLFSFLLPPQTTDRSSFKMTLILGYTVFLLIMNDLLPITGDTIPLMNVFLSLCLALMVASLLETILITNLLRGSAHSSPVPHWIRGFVLHVLGRLVQLPPKSRDLQDVTVLRNPAAYEMKVTHPVEGYVEAPEQNGPLNETKALEELRSLGKELQALRLQVEQQQLGGNQSAEEWVQVGLIIDRLLCGIYILFISVSFITIIAIWAQSYNTV
ncbi:putative 5-hydroxytryptamine receptor 3A-like [Scophthalmus maximus]|uniref:Putative 5-hydroxytryptamine receptor 3A-like n=2 Tax=Scophthalmus maximus TaxID=52904 RepID=A0A2U9C2K7_SCOMX|nr:putative 5-hydroxytryptamine receptor 3A-like [Scophthalmus maximus]